ncbi:hypothetical protein GGQ84_002773 [Desulfitispora alkaliphila]|uniref:hypothetical protein n=1 Tax=Desulfitispora alkaliphila TaxID=622674 RepID=UPI003D243196
MKVKIKSSLSGLDFSYKKGEEVELSENRGKTWIKAGVAVEVKKQGASKKASSGTSESKDDG